MSNQLTNKNNKLLTGKTLRWNCKIFQTIKNKTPTFPRFAQCKGKEGISFNFFSDDTITLIA